MFPSIPKEPGHVPPGPSSPSAVPQLRVGAKLKAARKARRLKLRDLALRVGCSESLISKIENDRATPSLPMLHKIAAELGTSIGKMFSEENADSGVVSRDGQRPIISVDAIGRDGGVGIRLEGVAINGELLYSSIHVVDAGGDSGGFIQHVGEELAFVLEGTVEINLDGKVHVLGQGDAIFFPSEVRHGYRNPGREVARILWINTPPTF
ncbi:HTH-type transcriptional regulator PuuR (plasmid) [Variovorax sp. SRS16]|uniref:cupin domain-containing protein n=1 Tax=Variovorax sp. SRS16 TaxID=282217 RepID=UPI0013174DCF|nr:cupin domain-containing protein [Variovorax sp. SRS16]VTU45943.1 HTH-type transcriptional regulator PuuR [Variovorax sp. SRS16]